jgi:hypothetical protein
MIHEEQMLPSRKVPLPTWKACSRQRHLAWFARVLPWLTPDGDGQTVVFLLTAHRDVAAARRFFGRAIDRHDVPEKITIDKSDANTAAVHG